METYLDDSGELQPARDFKNDNERLEFLVAWARQEEVSEPERRSMSQPSLPSNPTWLYVQPLHAPRHLIFPKKIETE